MPWEVPITVDGLEYPVRFNTEKEPTQVEIDEAVQQILQQKSRPASVEDKEEPGYLSQLGGALSTGYGQMTSGVGATFNALTGDVPDVAANLAEMGRLQREQQAAQTPEDLALSREFARTEKEYELAQGPLESMSALSGYLGATMRHPGAAVKQAVQSAPNALISGATGLAGYALGGLAGGAAGIETGPGAILTGIAGATAGGAISNSLREAGPAIYDILNEKTGGAAASMTADQIAEYLKKNPDIMSEGLKTGAIRGTVIGAIEGLGLKGAGRLATIPERAAARAAQKTLVDAGVDIASKEAVEAALKRPALRSAVEAASNAAKEQFTSAGNLARMGGAAGIEIGASGAGELGAQMAAGQEVSPTEIYQEMLGEGVLSLPVAATSKALEARKYLIPEAQAGEIPSTPEQEFEAPADTVPPPVSPEEETMRNPALEIAKEVGEASTANLAAIGSEQSAAAMAEFNATLDEIEAQAAAATVAQNAELSMQPAIQSLQTAEETAPEVTPSPEMEKPEESVDEKDPSTLSKVEVINKTKADLDERAKALGYDNARQLNLALQTQSNLSDEQRQVLEGYSLLNQEIKALSWEDASDLSDGDFSAWVKPRFPAENPRIEEELRDAVDLHRALMKRGDAQKAEQIREKIKNAKRRQDWTFESWSKRFPDEPRTQEEIDTLNAENAAWNAEVDVILESFETSEPTIQPEQAAEEIEAEVTPSPAMEMPEKSSQTITGFNVQTGTEMPVPDKSSVTSPGEAPLVTPEEESLAAQRRADLLSAAADAAKGKTKAQVSPVVTAMVTSQKPTPQGKPTPATEGKVTPGGVATERDLMKPEELSSEESAALRVSKLKGAKHQGDGVIFVPEKLMTPERRKAIQRGGKSIEVKAWADVTGVPSDRGYAILDRRARRAFRENKPVSAAAVDTYGIKLPEGYVKQGDLYVFQPQTTAAEKKPSPQPSATQHAAEIVPARSMEVSEVVNSEELAIDTNVAPFALKEWQPWKDAAGDFWVSKILTGDVVIRKNNGRFYVKGVYGAPSKGFSTLPEAQVWTKEQINSGRHYIPQDGPVYNALRLFNIGARRSESIIITRNRLKGESGMHVVKPDDIQFTDRQEILPPYSDYTLRNILVVSQDGRTAKSFVSSEREVGNFPSVDISGQGDKIKHVVTIDNNHIGGGRRGLTITVYSPSTASIENGGTRQVHLLKPPTAAETQTPVPLREGTGAAGFVQSEPVEGSIPTDEKESAKTAIESTEKSLEQPGYGAKLNAIRKFIRDLGPDSQKAQTQALNDLMAMPLADLQAAFEVVTGVPTKLTNKRQLANNILNEILAESRNEKLPEADETFRKAEIEAEEEIQRQNAQSLARIFNDKLRTNPVKGLVSSGDVERAIGQLQNSGEVPGAIFTWRGTAKELQRLVKSPAFRKAFPGVAQNANNKNAEGWFENGMAFIITDQVDVSDLDRARAAAEGTTPEVAAAKRVIAHENYHKGVALLSPKDQAQLVSLLRKLFPAAELDDLAKSYKQYADWRTNRASEYALLEEKMQKAIEEMDEVPRDGLLRELVDFLKAIWRKWTGQPKGEPKLRDLKDVVRLLRSTLKDAHKAQANRTANGGRVMMSLPAFRNFVPAVNLNGRIETGASHYEAWLKHAIRQIPSYKKDGLSDSEVKDLADKWLVDHPEAMANSMTKEGFVTDEGYLNRQDSLKKFLALGGKQRLDPGEVRDWLDSADVESARMSLGTNLIDAEYLEAVANGDMATAQRMVDEAAKAAGLMKIFHGTNRPGLKAENLFKSNDGNLGPAVYFTTTEAAAKEFARLEKGAEHVSIGYLGGKGLFLSENDWKNIDDEIFDSTIEKILEGDDALMDARKRAWEKVHKGYDFAVIGGLEVGVFNTSKIKPSGAVLNDAEGKIIPLSKRFGAKSTLDQQSEQDAAYMDAVKKGDMTKAQRMVDEAARKSGKLFGKWFHGQPSKTSFTVFNPALGKSFGGWNRIGSWFTLDKTQAKEFAEHFDETGKLISGKVYDSYLWINNPLSINGFDGLTALWKKYTGKDTNNATEADTEKFRNELRQRGFDGLVVANVEGDSLGRASKSQTYALALDPNQIKSADPVTYDDAGNVIPLSQRFQPASPDIRFSLSPVQYSSENDEIQSSAQQTSRSMDYTPRQLEVHFAVRKAYDAMPKDNGVAVPLFELFDKTKEFVPDLNAQEFSQIVQGLYDDNAALLNTGAMSSEKPSPGGLSEAEIRGFDTGQPAQFVAFHGTKSRFSEFDFGLAGKNFPDLEIRGVSLISSPQLAEPYALEAGLDEDGNPLFEGSDKGEPLVFAVHTEVQNPLVEEVYDDPVHHLDFAASRLYQEAIDGRHDAIIIRGRDIKGNVVAVFQILDANAITKIIELVPESSRAAGGMSQFPILNRDNEPASSVVILPGKGMASLGTALSPEEYARHAELESKNKAGTITPEETKEAEKLVEKAARRAGYNVGPVWHLSQEDFNEFSPEFRSQFGTVGPGFYFSGKPSKYLAKKRPVQRKFFLKISKPLPLDKEGMPKRTFMEMLGRTMDAAVEKKMEGGVSDGIINSRMMEGTYDGIYTVWNSEQIKSADPFTGVPLEQRFDVTSPDIRFSYGAADSSAAATYRNEVDVISKGLPVGRKYKGAPMKGMSVEDHATFNQNAMGDAAERLLKSLSKDHSMEEIFELLQQPDFQRELGLFDPTMVKSDAAKLTYLKLVAQFKQRAWNASNKAKTEGQRIRANVLYRQVSQYYANLTTGGGQFLQSIQQIHEDPRSRFAFDIERAENEMAKANAEAVENQSGPEGMNPVKVNIENMVNSSGESATEDVLEEVEEDQDAIDLAEGEATLEDPEKSLYEEYKDLLREEGILARLDREEMDTGAKMSISPERRSELAGLTKEERAKLREKNRKRRMEILSKLLGREEEAKTPEQKTTRKKREKMVQTVEKRAKSGKSLETPQEGETESSEEQVSKAERTAQAILKDLSERYSDPLIIKEKKPNVDAMRELYKERVKQGVGPNQMTEKSFVNKAVELGADETTAGILWKAAELEIDAREAMRQDRLRQQKAAAGERADAEAHRIIFATERLKRQSGFADIDKHPQKDSIIKAFRDQVKSPVNLEDFAKRLSSLKVSRNVAERLFKAAAREKADQEAMAAYDMLQGPDALKKMLRQINEMRPSKEAPLSARIPWAEILRQSPKSTEKAIGTEEYRKRIFDAMMASDAFKGMSDEQKGKLADLFSEAWEKKRTAILDKMLDTYSENLDHQKEKRKLAKALKDSRNQLLELVNLGAYNNDELVRAIGERFGLKTEFTAEEKAKLNEFADKLQDDTLNRAKRNKLAREYLSLLESATGIPASELLSMIWVTSVLNGGGTIFSIATSFLNGFYVIMGNHAARAWTELARGNYKEAVDIMLDTFKAMSKWLQSYAPSAERAWNYLWTGDVSLLEAAANDPFKNVKTLGDIQRHQANAERLAKDPKLVKQYIGRYLRFWGRLLTALDAFNVMTNKAGAMALAMRQSDLTSEQIKEIDAAHDMAVFKKRIIETDPFFKGQKPTDSFGRAYLNSLAEAEMYASLAKMGVQVENADFMASESAYTMNPTGVGGWFYNKVKQFDANLSTFSNKFVKDAEAHWAKEKNWDTGWEMFLAHLAQFLSYQVVNAFGLRFARFAGNKFNQGLSFIPGVGLLRRRELSNENLKGREQAFIDSIKRNQIAGLLLGVIGFSLLKAIADEPDDEKRGWGINGGFNNLTPDQKRQKLARGEKEYTIRIGNLVWNYQNSPIAQPLAAIGAMADMIRFSPDKWKGKNVGDKLMSSALSGLKATLEIPALTQVGELLGTGVSSKDPTEQTQNRLVRALAGWSGGFMPRFLKDIDYMAEPTMRKYETFWQKTSSHIPVYRRYTGKDFYDILGNPVEKNAIPGSREFAKLDERPEYQILGALNSRGIWLTPANAEYRMIGKGRNRRRLTQEEADKYSLESGKEYRKMLIRYGARALRMPPEKAKNYISDLADKARDRALDKVARK